MCACPRRLTILLWTVAVLMFGGGRRDCLADEGPDSEVDESALVAVVRPDPERSSKFKLVSQKLSEDGEDCTVVLEAPTGIFHCRIDLAKQKCKRLTLVIRDTKRWEGVNFTAKVSEDPIDLRTAEGVTIEAAKGDCVIRFSDKAMDLLRRGGGLQFVDQYRG